MRAANQPKSRASWQAIDEEEALLLRYFADIADSQPLSRKREEEQDYRHADPVIQATFDIQALPHLVRYGGIRDDSLSQRGVRRCEHGGDQGDFVEAEVSEYEKTQTQAECNSQRQADHEQSDRDCLDASQYAQVGIRRVRKQADGQREIDSEVKEPPL